MAALHFVEDDEDSLDGFSDEDIPKKAPTPPPAPPTSANATKTVTTARGIARPAPAPAPVSAANKPPAAPALRQSQSKIPAKVGPAVAPQAQPVRQPQTVKAFSVQKASAADWDDSDSSDDDMPPVKKVSMAAAGPGSRGWAPINGNHAINGNKAHVAGLKPALAKRGRGTGL